MTFFLLSLLYSYLGDRVIIYIDLVFLLNMFLDIILLTSVSVILTRNASVKRIIIGGFVGGISTFCMFLPINTISLFLIKIILGFLMCIVTFGFKNLRYSFNNVFYLYTTSFSIGGVLYLLMDEGIYNYFILIILFIIVSLMYVKQIKKFKNNYTNYYKVDIYYHNNKLSLTGFLDTGNRLFDTYKHRPIILIDKKIDYQLEEIIYVPYLSLNNHSIIKCLKTDKVVINNHTFNNYLIGLSNDKFKIDGVNCLLHSKMKGELNA